VASTWLAQARALPLLIDTRIWYLLLFSVAAAILSRVVIEILVPAEPPPRLPPHPPSVSAAEQQLAAPVLAPVIDPTRRPAADASVVDMLRQRMRQLELECDGLRAEAQRASRLEAELAAAHIRIEQLADSISSSKSARTPSAPTAAPAAAATPSCSDGTPFKVAHRTPSSAATKGLTVRASVLQKAQATPIATPSQLRFLGENSM